MADIKPLVNASGQIRPVHSGETVALANGGTGATTAGGARSALDVYSTGQVDSAIAGAGAGGGPSTIVVPQGRLSLTSGVAVMNADATAQSTVYYVPYVGKYVPMYSGSAWSMLSFGSGVSLALNSTDNLAGVLYDIFAYTNSGTVTLGTGPAWINTATVTITIASPAVVSWTGHGLTEGSPVVFATSGALPTGITAGTTYYVSKTSLGANSFVLSTSVANAAAGTNVNTSGSQSGTHTATNGTTIRGTGAGTTELELKDGIWTNKNSITLRAGGSSLGSISANQAIYLGTALMTANGQTGMAFTPSSASGGSANVLGLYNAYNRVPTMARERDSTTSWTYATGTWRAANNNVNNSITIVDGLQQSIITARYQVGTSSSAVGGAVGVGMNSTANTPDVGADSFNQVAFQSVVAPTDFMPRLGRIVLTALEYASTGTVTFTANLTARAIMHLDAQLLM